MFKKIKKKIKNVFRKLKATKENEIEIPELQIIRNYIRNSLGRRLLVA